jgi:hypothetical protein
MENLTAKEISLVIENTKKEHLLLLRKYAKDYIQMVWKELCEKQLSSCTSLNDMEHHLYFHSAIWEASTVILPNLEVQVVIDDNWKLHISSGTAGFVGFPSEPKGLKLPIRCWIHTHPFGRAYFSGIDWKTVSVWGSQMKCAYVLGGGQHYGFWDQSAPQELSIYHNDFFDHTSNQFLERPVEIQQKSMSLGLKENLKEGE